MSEATSLSRLQQNLRRLPWTLWSSQVTAILRLEIKKIIFARRSIGVLFLAALPVILFGLRTLVELPPEAVQQVGGMGVIFATIFRTLMLRLLIFFGCVGIFTGLFRSDVLEKTLHYYLLVPMRREVLVVGKYLSGLLTALAFFGTSTAISFILFYLPLGSTQVREFFTSGPGVAHLLAYLAVTGLACIGYGAVFLLIGLLVKNWIIPAALILGWESINFLLPPALKKISVIYYLESLCPVPLPAAGPITLLADPAPLWISIPGLLALTIVVLILASLRLRRMEIHYDSD